MKEVRVTVRLPDDLVAHIDAMVSAERAAGDRKSDRTSVILAALYLQRLAAMPAAERTAHVRQLTAAAADGQTEQPTLDSWAFRGGSKAADTTPQPEVDDGDSGVLDQTDGHANDVGAGEAPE